MATNFVNRTKLDSALVATANSIRSKTGDSNLIPFDLENETGFKMAIDNIITGGGENQERGVIFIDYNGEIIETWDSENVSGKTELPNNPTHDRLVAQGWNWSLADIKEYINTYPDSVVVVGQMYKTVSGLTEIDVVINQNTGKTVNCEMSGNKDWGDGSPTDSENYHTYSDYGSYTITCDGTSIPSGTGTGSSQTGGMFGSTYGNDNGKPCVAVYIGENVTSIGDFAFYYSWTLKNITIPSGVTEIGDGSFSYCFVISSVTLPINETNGDRLFTGCSSMINCSFPNVSTNLKDYSFEECTSLMYVTIPDGAIDIPQYAFSNCYNISKITIPNSVTQIYNQAFVGCGLKKIIIPDNVTEIGQGSFYNNNFFTNIIMPSKISTINAFAFSDCHNIVLYDFSKSESIPTLSDIDVFENINILCKIVVPDSLYDDWIVETNWSTYSGYIYKDSEMML